MTDHKLYITAAEYDDNPFNSILPDMRTVVYGRLFCTKCNNYTAIVEKANTFITNKLFDDISYCPHCGTPIQVVDLTKAPTVGEQIEKILRSKDTAEYYAIQTLLNQDNPTRPQVVEALTQYITNTLTENN